MTEATSGNSQEDEWAPYMLYGRTNIAVCNSMPHLMHRLHCATRHTIKFVLLTHCHQFEREFHSSKTTSRRLIMAVDPELLALMLRSSPVIASCALALLTPLTCDKDAATHLSTLIPHVAMLLSSLVDGKDLEIDTTTRAMLKRSGCTAELLQARLISDCLSFLSVVATFLGVDAIHKISLDVPDLEESVDDLNKEMFDFGMGNSDQRDKETPPTFFGSGHETCQLCSLIDQGDYKEVSIQLEQLYRDLDTLAAAHLDDAKLQAAEAKEYEDEADLCMGPLLLRVGNATLEILSATKEDATQTDAAKIHMSSLQGVMKLTQRTQFSAMLEACLSSKNFDVVNMLFELATHGIGNFADEEVQIRISNNAVNLLDKNLQTLGVALVSSFLTHMLEHHGLVAIDRSIGSGNFCNGIKRLSTILRRSEIEIHLALDNFFRHGSTPSSVSASFMLLETLLVCLSDNEALLPSCHELFTTIHRIVTTIFEFFDEVTKDKCETRGELLTCCTRLVGCWMTLEPLHLKSPYLKVLPKMLSVISPTDFTWLLPSFEYTEAIDIECMHMLLPSILEGLSLAIPTLVPREGQNSANPGDLRIISMSYKLIERLFLEGISEGMDLFMSIETPSVKAVPQFQLRGFDYHAIVENNYVHFNPNPPLDMSIPFCIDISTPPVAKVNVEHVVRTLQSFFLTVLHHEHGMRQLPITPESDDYIDLKNVQDAIQRSISSVDTLKREWSTLLSEAALATASASLCRFHQSVVRGLMDSSMAFIIMECLAVSFVYTCPRTAIKYVDPEEAITELWYRLALACTVLLQRQPDFINIFGFVCRKLRLKAPTVESAPLDQAVEEGVLSADCSVAVEFMCTLVSSLR